MDRLIALVFLHWKTELRSLRRAKARLVGLILALPLLALSSAGATAAILLGLPVLEARSPGSLLPVLSAAATGIGLLWALSPLLAGVAFTEAHDLTRVVHFPVRPRTLLAASFVANLLQPMVLAAVPPALALCFVAAGGWFRFPVAAAGVGLAFAFLIAASQTAGLLLHGLSRNRRMQDRMLLAGLGLGFVLGFLPWLLFVTHARGFGAVVRRIVASDVFAFSPFAWGVRAAVHAGRGEGLPFLVYLVWAALALLAVWALASWLVHRVYAGEAVLGAPRADAIAARPLFSGRVGALFEKELRVAWRDPALKATVLTGFLGPLLLLLVLSRGHVGDAGGRTVFAVAGLVGLSTFGANAFGLERRAVALLLGLPVPRWQVLLGKNLAALLLRLPALLALLVVGALAGPPSWLPAAATIAVATQIVALAVDNYVSVLFPVPVPEPGHNPYGGAAAGAGGLGAAAAVALCLVAVVALAAPFVFLAWLPVLLGTTWLWVATLPLALAGAVAVYGMLLALAGRFLERREPELVERVLAGW